VFPHDDNKREELRGFIKDELLDDNIAKQMAKSDIKDEIF
jgi:hypothetical protein